jgi:hypothetical protein
MAYMDEDALIREQMEYYRVRAPEYDVTSAPRSTGSEPIERTRECTHMERCRPIEMVQVGVRRTADRACLR